MNSKSWFSEGFPKGTSGFLLLMSQWPGVDWGSLLLLHHNAALWSQWWEADVDDRKHHRNLDNPLGKVEGAWVLAHMPRTGTETQKARSHHRERTAVGVACHSLLFPMYHFSNIAGHSSDSVRYKHKQLNPQPCHPSTSLEQQDDLTAVFQSWAFPLLTTIPWGLCDYNSQKPVFGREQWLGWRYEEIS